MWPYSCDSTSTTFDLQKMPPRWDAVMPDGVHTRATLARIVLIAVRV
jgi:hypothetical protein